VGTFSFNANKVIGDSRGLRHSTERVCGVKVQQGRRFGARSSHRWATSPTIVHVIDADIWVLQVKTF
jgi:hypothetical protein